ncbi:hypothetical protein [Pantoea vagans]|uniref:hypothetical protein n=1 Tax=Pantoea vagans TaxID=470934 RepID=UPI00320A1049
MHATIFEKKEGDDEILYIASMDEATRTPKNMRPCIFFSAAKNIPFEKGDKIKKINSKWYLISFIKVLIERDFIITTRNEAYKLMENRLKGALLNKSDVG